MGERERVGETERRGEIETERGIERDRERGGGDQGLLYLTCMSHVMLSAAGTHAPRTRNTESNLERRFILLPIAVVPSSRWDK